MTSALKKLRKKSTDLEKEVGQKVKKLQQNKELASWFTAFSNNILPPVFFLFIATATLHYLPRATSTLLRINLGIISLVSAALSLYIITLMF